MFISLFSSLTEVELGAGGTGGPPAVSAVHSHHPEEPDGKSKHLRERAPLWTWRAISVTNGFIYMQNRKEIYWISFTLLRIRPTLKATTTSYSTALVFSHFILLWERLARCCRCHSSQMWLHEVTNDSNFVAYGIYVSFEIIKLLSPNWNCTLSKTAAAAAECIVVLCYRRMYYKIILLPTTRSSQAS